MLPASFLAGMTTETVRGPVSLARTVRATQNAVAQNQGRTGASQRFTNGPIPRARMGTRIRGCTTRASQPASAMSPRRSGVESQLLGGSVALRPSPRASANTGLQRADG